MDCLTTSGAVPSMRCGRYKTWYKNGEGTVNDTTTSASYWNFINTSAMYDVLPDEEDPSYLCQVCEEIVFGEEFTSIVTEVLIQAIQFSFPPHIHILYVRK